MKKFMEKLVHGFYKRMWLKKKIYNMCVFSLGVEENVALQNIAKATKMYKEDFLVGAHHCINIIPYFDGSYDNSTIQTMLKDCCDATTAVIIYAESLSDYVKFRDRCCKKLYQLPGTEYHSVMVIVKEGKKYSKMVYQEFPRMTS